MREWLRRWLLKGTAPADITLTLYPYASPVDRNTYLGAWDRVRESREGEVLVRALHNNLVATLEERCPLDCRTLEQVALWQAGHDARKKVFLDLVLHAVKGSKLAVPMTTRKPPAVGSGAAQES